MAYEKGKQEAMVRGQTRATLRDLERYYQTGKRDSITVIVGKMIAAADCIAWGNKTGKFVGMLAGLFELATQEEVEDTLRAHHPKLLDKKVRLLLVAPALVLSGKMGKDVIEKIYRHRRSNISKDLTLANWELPPSVIDWGLKISSSDRRTDKYRQKYAKYLSPKVFLDEWTVYMYLGYFLITGNPTTIFRLIPLKYLHYIIPHHRKRGLNNEEERIQEFTTVMLDHYAQEHDTLRNFIGINSADAKAVSSEGLDEFSLKTLYHEECEARSRQIHDVTMRDTQRRPPASMYQEYPRTPAILKYERFQAERELAAARQKEGEQKRKELRTARLLQMERRRMGGTRL